jgi:Icc-related predicted phosphoesterase
MKIYICSDIHNKFLRFIPPEPVDLILCAGDITNMGTYGENYRASEWLSKLSGLSKFPPLYVPGNHDISWGTRSMSSGCHNILRTSFHTNLGVKVAGASLSVVYDMPRLAEVWENMTYNKEYEEAYYESLEPCDILVSHSPPSGVTGFCMDNQKDFGSTELRKWIELNQPKLVVCGHIHNPKSRHETIGKTTVLNTARIGQIVNY